MTSCIKKKEYLDIRLKEERHANLCVRQSCYFFHITLISLDKPVISKYLTFRRTNVDVRLIR